MTVCKACQLKNNIEITIVVIYKDTPIKITGRKWAVKDLKNVIEVMESLRKGGQNGN